MTRFARAQGSKASNLREPEEATPWHVMKQELEKKKYEKPEDTSERFSYKNYLEDNSEEPPTKWIEFSDEESGAQLNAVGVKKNKNKSKNKQKKLISVDERSTESEKGVDVENVSSKTLWINKNQTTKQNVHQGKTAELKYVKNDSEENTKRSKKRKHQADNRESQENIHSEMENIPKIGLNTKQNKLKKSEEREENKKFIDKKFKQNGKNVKFDKKRKFKDGKDKNRRKPRLEECVIGGKNVTLMYIDGFPVKKEDGERLIQLRKDLINKGVPRSEIEKAMKLERRRAEKALTREKKKLCFNCRGSGHVLSECPNISMDMTETTATGICFKCGSTEHTHFECKVVKNDSYKFAQCFICKEQGHISRQCPDNPKGLYPQGGGCNVCGDVTHLKKDCPAYVAQQEGNKIAADTIDDSNIDSIGHNFNLKKTNNVKKQKVVKF